MKTLGMVLVVVGILALAYGGFSYTKHKKVLDIGPIEAHVDEKKTVPISPIVGGVALVAGLLMIVTDRRRAG
jgi:uncharacterized membrane protein YidH (DUF202 family)